MPRLFKSIYFTAAPGVASVSFYPGGHTPYSDGDAQDYPVEKGFYSRLENADPSRRPGYFVKRRPFIQARPRQTGYTTSYIANIGYLPGQRLLVSNSNVLRDLLYIQYVDDNVPSADLLDFGVESYTVALRYTAANWSDLGTWKDSTAHTATSNNAYPVWWEGSWMYPVGGLAPWHVSSRGFISAPQGRYADESVPLRLFPVIRKGGKDNGGNHDGFFSHPSSGTEADRSGAISKTASGVAVPEKPSFNNEFTLIATSVIPETDSSQISGDANRPFTGTLLYKQDVLNYESGDDSVLQQSGNCPLGHYQFAVCPIDDQGEFGPPIKNLEYFQEGKALNLTFQYYDPNEGSSFIGNHDAYMRGVTIQLQINNVKTALDKLRPNIRGLAVFVKYTNPMKGDAFWTNSRDPGQNLPPGYGSNYTEPEDIQFSLWRIVDLNGRQYEPLDQTLFGAQWADASKWTTSDRFNRQLSLDGIEVRAVRETVSGTGGRVRLKSPVYRSQFSHNRYPTVLAATDNVHIEVDSLFGTGIMNNWFYRNQGDLNNLQAQCYLTFAGSGSSTLPAAWTANEERTIRFCYPWTNVDADNEKINLFLTTLDEVDRSFPMPFPDDANAGYSVPYFNYYHSAESPSGKRKLIAKTWNSGRFDDNVLRGTTNGVDGDRNARFDLAETLPIEITGIAFLDEYRFIVTGKHQSYFGKYKLVGDQWVFEIEDVPLRYGHLGWSLERSEQGIFGCDPLYGPWVVTYSEARSREDISPISGQRLLFNEIQQKYFRDTFTDSKTFEYLSLTVASDRLVMTLPKFGASSATNAKNNISLRIPNTSGSYYFTYWFNFGLWSLDYVYNTTGPVTGITAYIQSQLGPEGNVMVSTTTNIGICSDVDTDEQDKADGTGYNPFINIEWIDRLSSMAKSGVPQPMMRLQNIYLRLAKESATAISTTLTVTPYRLATAGTPVSKTALTGQGWVRGFMTTDDLFALLITDSSIGITAIGEATIEAYYHGLKI